MPSEGVALLLTGYQSHESDLIKWDFPQAVAVSILQY